jgi:hypothetical protein
MKWNYAMAFHKIRHAIVYKSQKQYDMNSNMIMTYHSHSREYSRRSFVRKI